MKENFQRLNMLETYLDLVTIVLSCIVMVFSGAANWKIISQTKFKRSRNFALFSLCVCNIVIGITTALRPLVIITEYEMTNLWTYLFRYLPIFSLISSLLHVEFINNVYVDIYKVL